jgi:hypothetical protein
MKKALALGAVIFVLLVPQTAVSQSAEELLSQFDQEYESLQPPAEGSSVSADYKIRQTALATSYSTRILGLLYRQNMETAQKYDEMLQKYEEIIRQNEQIIEILSTIVKSQTLLRQGDTEAEE